MTWIENIFPQHLIHAIGWTVIHSLWQGTVIAFVLVILFVALQRRSARLRYRVAYGALLLLLGASVATFIMLYDPSRPNTIQPTRLVILGNMQIVVEKSNFIHRIWQQFSLYFDEHLPLIVTVWLLGMLFFLMRLSGGLAYLRRMRAHGLSPVSERWQQLVDRLSESLHIGYKISLAESILARTPVMIGFFKPLILLPIGAINHLPADEVEAILAHEIAHIARQDFVFNIIQSLIEIIYYYHPAAWWISAVIRTERENACDDVAVSLCSNPMVYAKALLHIQELHHIRTPALALAFSGNRRNQLLFRIQRILNQPHNKSKTMEKFIATCALLCVLAALTYGSNDAGNPPAPPANIKTVIIAAVPDTIPATEKATSKKSKEVELIVEDGEIQSLKIDGETIPKSDYERYKDLTNNLIEESEITPPAPPAPPAPGYRRNMPVPPAPPAPAYPGHMPVPPAPPVPPVRGFSFDYQFAPEVRSFSGDNIQYHKTDDGRTVIIIDSDGRGENSEIRVEDGVVYLNGKRVESAAPEISEDILLRQYGYPYAPAIPEMRHLMELYTPEALAPYDALLWSEEGHKNRAKEMDKMRKEHKRAMKEHLKMREMMKKEQLEMMKKQKGLSGIEQQLEMEHAARLEADMRRQAELQMADIQMQELNGLISQEALREMEAALDAQDIAMSVDMPDLAEREASFIGSDFKNALEEHLMQDGFLKSRSGYKFRLSGNALTINGEKQSAEMFEKYKSLYESLTEQTLCDGCTIELSKSGTAPAPATRL